MVSAVGKVLSIKNHKHICEHGHTYFGNHCSACIPQKKSALPIIFSTPDNLLDSDFISAYNMADHYNPSYQYRKVSGVKDHD
jgi:hypothetical protein